MSLKHPDKNFFFKLRKRWLKRIPTKRKLIKNKYLGFISHRLHDRRLWRFDHHSVPIACGIGVFVAFLPIPFQMVLSVIIGLFARANLLLCIALVWISNPITMGPILYFCYKVGEVFIKPSSKALSKHAQSSDIFSQLNIIWQPLILGCFICAAIAGLGSYLIIRIYFWFYKIYLKYKHNQKLKKSQEEKSKIKQ